MRQAGAATAAVLSLVLTGAAAAQNVPVRLIGEVRVRAEGEQPAPTDTFDTFALLRSRLAVEAALSPRALVFLQVQDARVFGEEASTTVGQATRLDLHQGWLQYRLDVGEYGFAVRAGRQQVIFGNERLVGASGWTNTGRAFDGVRLTVGPKQSTWRVHGLAATVAERGRRLTGTTSETADHLFAGAYLDAGKLALFTLHDREAAYRTATGVDRTTVGGSVASPTLAGFTASVEGAYQFGNQLWAQPLLPVEQDIDAYMLGARIAYATPAKILPRLGIGVDLLSGDHEPTDDTYRAFNTLYATNHKFYGYQDLFLDPAARTRDRGLIDAIGSVRVGIARDIALDADVHAFRLQRTFSGNPERLLGWELDLTLPIGIGTGQQLQLGYSMFRNGGAAPAIGFGRDGDVWHWGYIQATFSFGGAIAPIL